jgi:hypothetical protein
MMTIEEEIQHIITFLSHPASFNIDMGGTLSLRPIDEGSPATNWEVEWEESDEGITLEFHKDFNSLEEAARFFVEKRRYMCNGMDFEKHYILDLEID